VPLNILVVDDNADSAQTTGWMVESMGHAYTLCYDGPGAMEKARLLLPDVILLDIGLPGMDGYEVCRTLRADPQFQKTIMVAQTGWGESKDRDEALAAGFNHHLVKPISLEQYSALFNNILSARS